jgi:GT2 family glycosyltransferase
MAASLDISFIIVTWNTEVLLGQCLESIRNKVQGILHEVIVVDNASTDGSAAMLERDWPEVVLIRNDENRGFAAANNQALRVMRGRYALLLNSDAVLTEDAAGRLYEFMEAHPEAAMACGQLLNADGSKQNSIAGFPTLPVLLLNTPLLEYLFPGRYPSKRYALRAPVEIDSGVGACLIVRKEAIDSVGPFDERYFFFMEETDWAFRMRAAGWKIFHVPDAFIYHCQGQSIGGGLPSRIAFYRSRYQYFRKWNGDAGFLVRAAIVAGRLCLEWFLIAAANILTLGMNRSLRSRWGVYLQLILWHLRGCP